MRTQSPVHALLRIVGICATVILLAAQIANAQSGDWERGKLIGLRAGTCIREGPGLNYRAHTQVPEDNWTVMVIDGSRTTGSEVWYDTSRKAAGDPRRRHGLGDGGLERPRLQLAGHCPAATTAT